MANLKSSKKDIRRTERRTEANKPFARNAKMLPKKVEKLVSNGAVEEAKGLLSTAFKALDKAAKRNIVHKNTASRAKSRLSKLVSGAEKAK
jgi:small subunit ribosomal protein S20